MATGDGITWNRFRARDSPNYVPGPNEEIFRQVFWVRYINWGLTHPLIIINLAFLAGLNGASLLVAVAADLVMLVSGLTATFSRHHRQWVWYTISCIGYLTLVYQIGVNGRRAASNKHEQTQRFFRVITGATLLVLLLYPMCVARPFLSFFT
jgi:bacteriorhodopsin